MPSARRRSKPCLNTSIRFKKNVSALNTSRKILQKSMNCSMLRAASLKSNNASLAKKVAELQLELGAQRTAAREAAIESCRLQMQVARFQPLLEARDQLKDSLLQLRELLATMLDTDMAVMRCVNEMASIVEGPENGGDKSFSNTTAWFSDTILEMSNLIRFDKTLRDTSRAVPSPILPPKRQRTAVTSAHDPLLGGIPQGSTHSPEILSAVNTSRRTVQSISPPVVINLSNSVTNPPEPKHTPTSQSCQDASDSSFPDQPNVIIQSPIDVAQPGSSNPGQSPTQGEPSFVTVPEPKPASHYDLEVIPAEIIPEEYRTSLPRTTQTPSDLPHSSVGQKTPSDHDVNSPVQCRLELKMNPDTESRRRIQPRRQAQLNAKPIIDLSTSHIFDLSVDHSARKPRTKRRRRLIHADDDDEDDVTEDDHTDSAKKTTRVKRAQKPTKKTTVKTGGAQQRQQQQTDGRSPPVARVVEVLFAKPGRVAFRADAKHQQPTTLTSGQRNDPSKTARDGEFIRPKSVFDLSANQTINMSILPPTLDELRQREQAKKETQNAKTQQSNDTENRKPSASISSPHVTVVLSPLKSTNGKDPNGPVLRGVLTEQNPNSHARSFKRRRLALVDDDDDQLEGIHTDPKGKTTSHEPSGTKTAKPFVSLSDAKQASEAVASRTESRSKRTAKT